MICFRFNEGSHIYFFIQMGARKTEIPLSRLRIRICVRNKVMV